MGKSGAGKSTVMHIIGCIDNYDEGNVIAKMNEREKSNYRSATVGIVIQDFALLPDYTVYENVALPLIFRKKVNRKKSNRICIGRCRYVRIQKSDRRSIIGLPKTKSCNRKSNCEQFQVYIS